MEAPPPSVRLPDGRIALGFAALSAGWNVRQAASAQRMLIAPSAPLTNIPTYSLATLLDCLSSETGTDQVRRVVDGRIVVVGTTVAGEDEQRGPTRFLGRTPPTAPSGRCAAQPGLVERAEVEDAPGVSCKSQRSDPGPAGAARTNMAASYGGRRPSFPFRDDGLFRRGRTRAGRARFFAWLPRAGVRCSIGGVGTRRADLLGCAFSAQHSFWRTYGCQWDIRFW